MILILLTEAPIAESEEAKEHDYSDGNMGLLYVGDTPSISITYSRDNSDPESVPKADKKEASVSLVSFKFSLVSFFG